MVSVLPILYAVLKFFSQGSSAREPLADEAPLGIPSASSYRSVTVRERPGAVSRDCKTT